MDWTHSGATPGADNNPTIPSVHVDEFREIVREVINQELALSDTPIGRRWGAGTLILKPGDPSLKSKEIPIEAFFHKIVMVRDRLRVLEQKLNGHKVLSDAEKVDLQQYITRIYGSLTTFNILFRDSEDQFVGASGKDEE